MSKISGSDGFLTGLPGICTDCFKEQTHDPHPPYYYCEHNQRLVVWRDGLWETFRDVDPEQISQMIEDDPLVESWHTGIIAECEKKLGRPLAPEEKRFIASRRGLIALEVIQDTVHSLAGSDLEKYLNSDSGPDR